MRISDWSSDVCSSDLPHRCRVLIPGLVDIDPHRSTVTDALDNLLDMAQIICRGAHAKLDLEPVVPTPLDHFLGDCDVPLRVAARQGPGNGDTLLDRAAGQITTLQSTERRRVGNEGVSPG